ncbi:MAG: hypothetical protein ACXW6K_02775 [Candidatus Binatia bacterium]
MFNRSRISRRTAPCDVPDGAHPESQRVQRGNARQIDEEVKQILSESHGRARNILASHRTALDELAGLLLEKEVIDRPALQAILKVRSIDSLKEKRRAADFSESESHQSNAERE